MREVLRRWYQSAADVAAAVRRRACATRVGRVLWRISISVVGAVVIVVGVILLPLPGPGWVVIFAGLGILATEYEWARRLLRAVRTRATQLAAKARRRPEPDAPAATAEQRGA
jgi:uncharacterized protein (TIGR02611 family)